MHPAQCAVADQRGDRLHPRREPVGEIHQQQSVRASGSLRPRGQPPPHRARAASGRTLRRPASRARIDCSAWSAEGCGDDHAVETEREQRVEVGAPPWRDRRQLQRFGERISAEGSAIGHRGQSSPVSSIAAIRCRPIQPVPRKPILIPSPLQGRGCRAKRRRERASPRRPSRPLSRPRLRLGHPLPLKGRGKTGRSMPSRSPPACRASPPAPR